MITKDFFSLLTAESFVLNSSLNIFVLKNSIAPYKSKRTFIKLEYSVYVQIRKSQQAAWTKL